MVNIYDYIDYKEYLQDFFKFKQESRADFSFGMWSRQLGLKTTASLTMIVNGDRHPGKQIVEKFHKYFDYEQEQVDYFSDLIQLKKSEGKDIALHLALLRKIKAKNNVKFNLLSEEVFSRICKWYYFAIREMILLKDFKSDPEWITNKLVFDVNLSDVEQAIEELLELGLIKRNSQGELENCTDGLNTYDEMPSQSIQNFHHQMLDNAHKAINEIEVDKRYVSALTIPVNSKNLNKLKQFVRKVEDEILEMFVEDNPDCVYQMNLQFFPLTKVEEE
ncbi:TIGR02147 family protein [Halobacteriovorax sp. GFR7]|uniref:TIGR02147 family protein n=1 Tax=unclassified Halobacteriovorax TaxID=2639665 RepID=UPI003D96D745